MQCFVVYDAVELERGEAGIAREDEEADECAWEGVSLAGSLAKIGVGEVRSRREGVLTSEWKTDAHRECSKCEA